ncbi:MAG: hypothetical protein B7Z68_12255 [Acidobacteria bacterium 21-70-11]|nr:MAG: hypothetical protein B7Z68_12255 [Acidobacteria bacterium 21-70-11]
MPRVLDAVEVRVLGCLLEKQQATPEYYPLTLNALVAACNQKSNRDPVMDLADADVRGALERLRAEVLVWPVERARAERWEHNLDRSWELDAPSRALVTVLLLRGPQTPGELRSRCERLHPFGSVGEVEAALGRLAAGPEPLVAELPRGAGQKESRWTHLVAGAPPERAEPAPARQAPAAAGLADRVAALEQHVAELAGELTRLAAKLGDKG